MYNGSSVDQVYLKTKEKLFQSEKFSSLIFEITRTGDGAIANRVTKLSTEVFRNTTQPRKMHALKN